MRACKRLFGAKLRCRGIRTVSTKRLRLASYSSVYKVEDPTIRESVLKVNLNNKTKTNERNLTQAPKPKDNPIYYITLPLELPGPTLPSKSDVLLTDVTSHLHSRIAPQIYSGDDKYLSDASQNDSNQDKVPGILYGPFARPMVPLILARGDIKKHMIFLVDTGAPLTYLSAEAWRSFGLDPFKKSLAEFQINEKTVDLRVADDCSHYSDINLLGADVMRRLHCQLIVTYPSLKCQLLLDYKIE
eukprot:TRINITY_DN25692_c0_g1_i1.p1 TRINITY_DN25692_c0_g1~~TRINITY_DN25692_c0_g1_i1.p1  ORF type:complete len:244 (-),score=13.90 TRINITY_DN25692_c0_g1_i1:38-769(-)